MTILNVDARPPRVESFRIGMEMLVGVLTSRFDGCDPIVNILIKYGDVKVNCLTPFGLEGAERRLQEQMVGAMLFKWTHLLVRLNDDDMVNLTLLTSPAWGALIENTHGMSSARSLECLRKAVRRELQRNLQDATN